MKYIFISIFSFSLIFYACATSEPVAEEDSERAESEERLYIPDLVLDDFEAFIEEEDLSDDERLLMETRSSLEDRFVSGNHDMPDLFLQEAEEDEEIDIYAGFRIQILSTRDIEHADSTQANFNAWADTTFTGYNPQAYVFFRQPYYRVRVGDFHDRERAIELSRMIKPYYPDAWVVHDRINPFRVPEDTVEFGMQVNHED